MRKLLPIGFLILVAASLSATPLTADQKAKVDMQIKQFSSLGTDPVVVQAVKDYIASPPPELKGMTQDNWAKLSVLSPEIKLLTKNNLALYLKSKKSDLVDEMFVSAGNGDKVALLAKSSSWNHKGKPKHDIPMTGKIWIDEIQLDESSGKQSVQFSFPVMDGGMPIGSIVVGLDISLLK